MNRRPDLIFLSIGLALRLWHYARGPSLWHDEAALILNVIAKDYGELLGGLFHHEAGPPLFLWIERFFAETFGDGLWSLRFPALAASCLALVGFWNLSRRTLDERAVPWAVLLFAVSDRLLWHGGEAKPYSFDVLTAVFLLQGFERTRIWSITRQCIFWMPLLPLAIWLSFPACFMAGGIVGGLLVRMFERDRVIPQAVPNESQRAANGVSGVRAKPLTPFAALCLACSRAGYLLRPPMAILILAVIGSFLALLFGPVAAQRDGPMEACWANHFPNWSKPLSVPFWSLFSALDAARYNLVPLGQLLVGIAAVGAVVTRRAGGSAWLAALLLPAALAFAAACLHKYPFGGSRLEVFLAPALIWLVAAGVPASFDWLDQRIPMGRCVLTALLLVPAGQSLYRAAADWPRADCGGAAEYVRENRRPAEAVIANHWEFDYYFRGADGPPVDWLKWGGGPPPAPEAWLLYEGEMPAADRERQWAPTLRGAEVLDRREFFRVTVVRVRFGNRMPKSE